ncbi:MAG: tetratricopeptide repeat protein [bacterium]|nr:tetratricopeptide repeat protein [bacterium]
MNKEQTNAESISKWRDALAKYAPDDITRFSESYRNYVLATRQLATVQSTNVDAQRAYLDILRAELETDDVSRPTLENLIRETETLLRYHVSEPKDGKWNTLRRYRGIAIVQIMSSTPDVKPELLTQGREDLAAAIAADPADAESVVALEAWYEIQRSRLDAVTRSADIAELAASAQATIDTAIAANPSNPLLLMAVLRREFAATDARLRAGGTPDPKVAQAELTLAREKAMPQLDATAAAMKAAAGGPKFSQVMRLRQLEQVIDPQSQSARTEEVLRSGLESNPENSEFLLMQGDVLAERLQFPDAIASVQKIIDAKPKPISLEGYQLFERKNRAVFLQALWGVKNWEQVKEPGEKATAIAYARERFEVLKTKDDPESPQIALISAYLAFVDQKYIDANRAIDQYNNKVKSRNPDAMWLKAVISEQVREPGASKRALEELLRMRPNDLRAIIALARIEASLGSNDRAEQLTDIVLKVLPEYPPAVELKKVLLSRRGEGDSTDPLTVAIMEIDRLDKSLAEAKDPQRDEKVLALIEAKNAQFPTDVRMAQIRAIQNVRMNRRDEARRVVEAAIAANPDSEILKSVLIGVNNPDPVKQGEEMIKANTTLNDLERAIALYSLYQNAGRRDEAAAQLNLAIAANPEDPRVIELQFMRALELRDFATGQAASDRAVASNLDGVGGASFRARLFAARGQFSEAITTLEQAISKGGASPEMWRLMGRIQNSAGKNTDAIKSFREALTLRPSDVPTINDLVQTLIASGRGPDALAACKEFERFAGGDMAFGEQSLLLEARFGDKNVAIERRTRLAKTSPENRRNNLELASLLIDAKKYDDAKKLVDSTRASGDGVDAAGLDAAWYWSQGRRDEAKAVFEGLLDKPLGGQPANVGPYLAYAGFLTDRGFVEDATAILERARAKQDPKTVDADRALSDLAFAAADYPKAGEAARRVVDAGADESGSYRKRLAESLIREGKFAEAEKELNLVAAGKEPDMVTTLLLSDAKIGLGDERAARTLLDSAVARFQTEPSVFMKRGQFLLGDPKRARDALADFSAAIRLKPDSWQALRLRAAANVALNDVVAALADLRAAVKVAPNNDELVLGLVSDLIRMQKPDEASSVAEEVIKTRSADVGLMTTLGDLFSRYEQWPAAARFHGAAFELDQQDGIAQRLLESLLSMNPPEIARAEQVLSGLEARVSATPGFLMAYARVRNAQGRLPEADRFAIEAVKLLDPEKPSLMIAWFNDVQKVQTDPAKVIKFLDAVTQAGVGGDWMVFFKAGVLSSDTSTTDTALTMLRDLSTTTPIAAVKQLSFRQMGNTLFSGGKNEEAAKVWEESLAIFPNDFESANNLAYVYVKFLNRPADALPLAERASAGIPNSADVLDTVGLAQAATGKNEDSIATFRRAWLLADSSQSKATIGTHLLRVFDSTQQTAEAKELIRVLDDLVSRDGAEISPEIKSEFDQLRGPIMKK